VKILAEKGIGREEENSERPGQGVRTGSEQPALLLERCLYYDILQSPLLFLTTSWQCQHPDHPGGLP
jgi:hypothetical protein